MTSENIEPVEDDENDDVEEKETQYTSYAFLVRFNLNNLSTIDEDVSPFSLDAFKQLEGNYYKIIRNMENRQYVSNLSKLVGSDQNLGKALQVSDSDAKQDSRVINGMSMRRRFNTDVDGVFLVHVPGSCTMSADEFELLLELKYRESPKIFKQFLMDCKTRVS